MYKMTQLKPNGTQATWYEQVKHGHRPALNGSFPCFPSRLSPTTCRAAMCWSEGQNGWRVEAHHHEVATSLDKNEIACVFNTMVT